ncbi:MAG: calcium-binding protein, partial [Alphaproteobacteria bacterium]
MVAIDDGGAASTAAVQVSVDLAVQSTTLTGTPGDDVLTGTLAADTIDGLAGNDTLIGDGGNDTLIGGSGLDLLQGGTGDDLYIFSIGDDLAEIRDSGGTADRVDIVSGFTNLADVIRDFDEFGFFFDDSGTVLVLEMGEETALGPGRSDFLAIADATGTGKIEQFTFDFLPGLVFDFGTAGTAGNDLIVLDNDTGIVNGLAGDDFIFGKEGSNDLSGGTGSDILVGHDFSDILDGGDDNDSLFGDGGNDILTGGLGDDFLAGDSGDDTLNGGAGNDTYFFENDGSNDIINDTVGTDTLMVGEFRELFRSGDHIVLTSAAGGTVTVLSHFTTQPLEQLVLLESSTTYQLATGTAGTTGNDALFGQAAGGETLSGGDGDDILSGGGGGDTLQGGAGSDILFGASGNDVLDGGDGIADIVNYRASSEGISVDLSSAAQQAISASMGDDTLTNIEGVVGSDFDDTITGSAGDNILEGAGGNDALSGGGGDDTYRWGVGKGLDTITDSGGASDLVVFQTDTDLTPDILDAFQVGNNLEIRNAFAPSPGGMTIVNIFTTDSIEGFVFDDLGGALLLFSAGTPTAGNDFIVL